MRLIIIDLAVIVAYLVGITAYGIYVGRKAGRTHEGYFIGNRRFTWMLIGASIFATNISSTQFLGESGWAHKIGLAAANNGLLGGLMLTISAIFFIPLYLRSRLYTVPQFLELRYNRTSRLIYGTAFVTQGILASPIGFYAGGLAVLKVFNFDPKYLWLTCLLVGLTGGVYTVVGGLTAVVYTEFVQCFLTIGGALLVVIIGLHKVGGLSVLMHSMGASHFRLLLPASNAELPWTAVIPGVAIHSAFYAFCSVSILQRTLGAKDLHHARCGMLFGAFLKLCALLLLALPGVIAAQLYPHAIADASYPMLVRNLLPVGVSGLVLAGLLAALMSSSESGLMALSSVIAIDLYPALVKSPSEGTALWVGKTAAAAIMLFGMIAAPFIGHLGMIYPLVLKIDSFMATPVGVCFLFGRFSRRVTHQAAVITMATGIVTGIMFVVLTSIPTLAMRMPPVIVRANFYHIVPVFFAVSTLLLFAISAVTRPPAPAQLEVLALRRQPVATGEIGLPRWRRFSFWWVVFVAAFIAIYIVFK